MSGSGQLLPRALLLAVVGYAVTTVVRVQGTELPWLDNVGYSAIALAAAALALAAPLRRRHHRRAWRWLGAGVAAWALGELYWDVFLLHEVSVPIPSWSDACWVAFYPLSVAGLIALARSSGRRIPMMAWLDGLVAALGAAALVSAAVRAAVDLSEGATVSTIVNLAYPVGDILLLALVVGSAVVDRRAWSRGRWEMTIGLVAFAAADVGYLVQVAHGTYVEGTLLDVGWILGLALLASAGWRPEPPITRTRSTGVVLPTIAAVASMLVLLAGRGGVGRVAFLLALACIAVALLRTLLTVREVRSLADSRRLAHTDELTGLGNRRQLATVLARSLDTPVPEKVALLLIDLDEFKEINDTLGHAVGDDLLVEVGTRLQATLRDGDQLTRPGGDEFAVVLRHGELAAATSAAADLLEQLQVPIDLGEAAVRVSASIGIALAPDHARTAKELLQHADTAMYRAKRRRIGFAVYEAALDEDRLDRLRLAVELADALERDELVVHYQPTVRVDDGRPVSVEALVRWQHPTRGLLVPDQFLPVAEHAGLMHRVTEIVVRTAVADARAWRGVGHDVAVAVNLSSADLLDVELPSFVARTLLEHDLPGSALVLEIVEDALMAEVDQVRATLHALRALGVRIAVDDFGTGHSSLGRIWELPVDELKLDRSFVSRMCDDSRPQAIVRAGVQLAEAFSFTVVAEGVEDARTLSALGAVGCDLAQGWEIARPMPFEQTVRWLDDQRLRTPTPSSLAASSDGRVGGRATST